MADREPEIRTIFCEALELPTAAALSAYLRQACQGKPELRKRIEGLLDAHRRAQRDAAERQTLDHTAASPPTAEQPFTRIGGYRLIQELGEGGFGIVYLAEQQPMHRQVALKIIKPGMDTREVITRFESERQALALMDHPNIAHVYDAGATESGRPYFVMERVHGVPITDYCDQHEMTIRDRLILFVTVCRAVQHAHQKGIIHRDIKPSNILVVDNEDVPFPKVIDFGVAKAIGGRLSDWTTATGLGQLVGTPMYMSPEQACRNGHDVDTRSDIYSLGVLLYELLTGTLPFDMERFRQADCDEICAIIRDQQPSKPSTRITKVGDTVTAISAQRHLNPAQLRRTLRGELDWIVMKALEKDRVRRYETATALAQDVERYLRDEPVEACPPSTLYHLGKYVRRSWKALATVAVLIVVLSVATSLATWQAIRATHAERHSRQQEELAEQRLAQANIQRASAEEQRSHAQKNLQLACDALEKMLNLVVSDHLGHPGSATERRELLESGLGLYRSLLAESHDDPAVLRAVGNMYERLNDGIPELINLIDEAELTHREAISIFEKLAAMGPEDADIRYSLAQSYFRYGQALGLLGRYAEQGAAYQSALTNFDKAIRLDQSNSSFYIGRGEAYLQLSEFEKAQADFSKGLECVEKGSFLFRQLLDLRGYTYLRLDEKERALRDYEQLMEGKLAGVDTASTSDSTAAMIRAGILLLSGRKDEYRHACAAMVERFGTQEEHSLSNAGTSGRFIGQDEWDRYMIARACSLAPHAVSDPLQVVEFAQRAVTNGMVNREPWYTCTLGMAYYRAGQLEQASECFHASTESEWIAHYFSWFGLALVHHQFGDDAQAREYLARAIDGLQGNPHTAFTRDWVELQLIRREAENLIGNIEEDTHAVGHELKEPAGES